MNRYLDKFLSYIEIEKNYSSHTILNYRIDLDQVWHSLGEVPVEKIDYLTLRKYLADIKTKNYKPRTTARKLSAIRSFFRFLHREGHIKTNPAILMQTPKLDKLLPNFLSEKEMTDLIEAPQVNQPAGRRDRAILETLYSAGIRVSELVGLNIDNVDMIGNVMKVAGKGKKERLVPIGDKAVDAIRDYLKHRKHQ